MSMRLLARLGWLLPLLALHGCGRESPPPYRQLVSAYGAPVVFTVQGIAPGQARAAVESAVTDLQFIAEVTNPTQAGPLGRTNQLLAAAGEFSANPSLLPLIQQAQQLSRQSRGRFNPALGGLLEAWGFYRDPPQGPPPEAAPLAALVARHPTMDDIAIDGIRVRCRNGAVRLDFGDYGRGYALDTALARLREHGVANASLTTTGAAARLGDGPATTLSVYGADGKTALVRVRLQPGEAAYTVSAARRSYSWQGRRYHAPLDPATGAPAEEVFAVTVIDTSLARAAAAATALFVAGPDHWLEAARDLDTSRALLVDAEDTVHATAALAPRVTLSDESQTVIVDGL